MSLVSKPQCLALYCNNLDTKPRTIHVQETSFVGLWRRRRARPPAGSQGRAGIRRGSVKIAEKRPSGAELRIPFTFANLNPV